MSRKTCVGSPFLRGLGKERWDGDPRRTRQSQTCSLSLGTEYTWELGICPWFPLSFPCLFSRCRDWRPCGNSNVEQRRIRSPAFKEFITQRGRHAFVNSLVGTYLGPYLFQRLWKVLSRGRNIKMTPTWICPRWSRSLIMWRRKAEMPGERKTWRNVWVPRGGRYSPTGPPQRKLCRIWPWEDRARSFQLMDIILINSWGW